MQMIVYIILCYHHIVLYSFNLEILLKREHINIAQFMLWRVLIVCNHYCYLTLTASYERFQQAGTIYHTRIDPAECQLNDSHLWFKRNLCAFAETNL